ncbi:MAG: ATP-binding protein [Gammaproteobacteria bacterium]|nr:ATP-binding protein [Gammaproteobacteria bacterium]
MIRSIRHFLLISLLISITVASSITAIGNYLLDKQVTQTYLDGQLIKNFSFIEILTQSSKTDDNIRKEIAFYFNKANSLATKNLLFQVWSKEGKLILYSASNSIAPLKDAPIGFSDRKIQNNNWRVYAEVDSLTNAKIVVAELYDIRNKLADDITVSNAYILLVTYPLFGFLVWLIIGLALRSITKVTSEISNRASTYLEPVAAENIPIEIKPLVAELNQLFIRLKLAFERNKRFAADAAHELRTPLAALKTQAQVALKSDTELDRHNALLKVLQGVDRSSHMVAQLLTLSRLGQEEALSDIKPVDLHKLASEILAYLVPVALEKFIEIELAPPPPDATVLGNDITLGILIRNIVDNAIRYTPLSGEVKVQIINENNHIIFRVTDSGAGIPPELRERVFERFFRVLGTTASGSGLGLAIVSQIADLHHAEVVLGAPLTGTGLQFDVIFSKYYSTPPISAG